MLWILVVGGRGSDGLDVIMVVVEWLRGGGFAGDWLVTALGAVVMATEKDEDEGWLKVEGGELDGHCWSLEARWWLWQCEWMVFGSGNKGETDGR
ncbi:hypothetical protein V6N12_007604 [Hibiscus sabdariffa]|uniref:Uncharacterized protein n=1 Tax=Hibiscus sabdariffa TaxID=183260 RepID=A0ABR2F295_9ROSI